MYLSFHMYFSQNEKKLPHAKKAFLNHIINILKRALGKNAVHISHTDEGLGDKDKVSHAR